MKYRFDECELDANAHTVTVGGTPVHVEPQVFDLLHLLAEAAGDLVTYDRLTEFVWKGRIVSDATIAARISAARTAVGDSGKRQAVIETVTRCGVRLVVPVSRDDSTLAVREATPLDAHDVRMTRSRDGTVIAWSTTGKGPPLLRAGHWLTHLEKDLTSSIWRPWITRLGQTHRLVRYDPRGTGMSARDCPTPTVETAVEDMVAVADAACLDHFALLASSQSAAIAFHYAARFPERISRIVTIGGFVQGSRIRAPVDGNTLSDALELMIRQGWGKPTGGYLRSLGTLFMPNASEEELNEILALQAASADAERAVAIRNCCSYYDEVGVLQAVKAPVLVAHSLNDSIHPFSQAQLIAAHLPDARILQLETSNHLISPHEPAFETLMQAIEGFLG
jgi:DNA-binding winged helix-turn-helix (wHTH) protein/predicted alpha/beta hydrolase family esterase